MSAVWSIPVEAVRHGVTMDGALVLGDLARQYARYQPTATVELFETGFVATLVYTLPGHPNRIHHAHVKLLWAPIENRFRPPAPVRPGEGPLLDVVAQAERSRSEEGTAR